MIDTDMEAAVYELTPTGLLYGDNRTFGYDWIHYIILQVAHCKSSNVSVLVFRNGNSIGINVRVCNCPQ